MPQAPTVAELVEQFRLKERGRESGRQGLPPTDSPRLDSAETEVVAHCEDLFTERRVEYNRHRANFEERMRSRPAATGSAADVEQACLDLRARLEEERPELERLARQTQQAIGDYNQFRREEGLTRDADYPESRILHFGFLGLLIVVETVINGLFFGANVAGGIFAGTSYAVLISLLNVVGLGLLASWSFRKTRHRDPLQKVTGWTLLALVVVAAIGWNLFVGHYREALAVDYPPQPDAGVVQPAADAGTPTTDACWRGPEEADADQEALCLFLQNPVRLGGFYSYMLLIIGLLAWLLGAADGFKLDDPYPGYGSKHRRRKKMEKELSDERSEILEKLRETQNEAQAALSSDFTDPIDARSLALNALDRLQRRHRDLCDFAKNLEASIRGALNIYRNSNREARSTLEPAVWQSSWTSDWDLPDPPNPADVITEEKASDQSGRERQALESGQAALRTTFEDLQRAVNDITRVDPHDRAGPR